MGTHVKLPHDLISVQERRGQWSAGTAHHLTYTSLSPSRRSRHCATIARRRCEHCSPLGADVITILHDNHHWKGIPYMTSTWMGAEKSANFEDCKTWKCQHLADVICGSSQVWTLSTEEAGVKPNPRDNEPPLTINTIKMHKRPERSPGRFAWILHPPQIWCAGDDGANTAKRNDWLTDWIDGHASKEDFWGSTASLRTS